MNEEYVYMKLVTGETLMALKEYEDEELVVLRFPMLVKTHLIGSKDGKISEQVTAGPYSAFMDDSKLNINRQHIVFDSQLSLSAIPHYINLVKDHEGVSLEYTPEELQWEDDISDELSTVGDLEKAIAQLKSIAEEEVELEDKVYVEGNKTLH